MTVHVNSFAKRQTKESRFSHYDGTFWDLAALVATYMDSKQHKGKKDGILEVPVPPEGFYSGVVELKEGDKLVGSFEARRNGEEPRKTVQAVGARKLPAKSVKIILYSSKLLSESGDNELGPWLGNWEVISINASACEGDEPINPQTLMYNYFGMDGGTDPNLTVEEFVEVLRVSVGYWKDKANCAGS